MANPYTAQLLEASTRLRVNPFDTGLLNSLVAFSVLFGIALFFALASLALRWRNGTLWVRPPVSLIQSDDGSMVRTFGGQCADDSLFQFFRTVATRQGSLVVCHESNVHTLFSIAFLAAVRRKSFCAACRTILIFRFLFGQIQHYLLFARRTSTSGMLVQNSVIVRTYPSVELPLNLNIEYELIDSLRRWYILYLSSWSIIWESFTTAYIETGAAEKKSRLSPKMINIFFIAFPLVIAIIPCFSVVAVANMRYNTFFSEFCRLRILLFV